MNAGTALIVALLLPLFAAVVLGLGAWLSSLVAVSTPVARVVAATVALSALIASLVLTAIAGSAASPSLPELPRYALLCDDFSLTWHMASLLVSLILLAGFRLYATLEQAASFLLASGVTVIAGCAGDILLQIVCVEIAAAVAVRAGSGCSSRRRARGQQVISQAGALLLLATGGWLLYGVCGSTELAVATDVMRSTWQISPQGDAPPGSPSLAAVAAIVLLICGAGGRLVQSAPADEHAGTAVGDTGGEGSSGGHSAVVWLVFPRAAALAVLLRLGASILPTVHQPAVASLFVLCLMASLLHGLQLSGERRLPQLLNRMAAVHSAALLTGVVAVVLHNSPVAVEPAGAAAFDARSLMKVTAAAFFLETLAMIGLQLMLESLRQPGAPLVWEEELAGLARCRPVSGVAAGLLLLATMGAIPLMTCWPRLLLLQTVFSVHSDPAVTSGAVLAPVLPAVALCALCGLMLQAVAALRLLSVVLLEPPRRPTPTGKRTWPLVLSLAIAAGLLAGGLLPFVWWNVLT